MFYKYEIFTTGALIWENTVNFCNKSETILKNLKNCLKTPFSNKTQVIYCKGSCITRSYFMKISDHFGRIIHSTHYTRYRIIQGTFDKVSYYTCPITILFRGN